MMTDLEVGFDGVELPRPSGGDCSLPASALTKRKAGGLNPGSGVGVHSEEGYPRNATIFQEESATLNFESCS